MKKSKRAVLNAEAFLVASVALERAAYTQEQLPRKGDSVVIAKLRDLAKEMRRRSFSRAELRLMRQCLLPDPTKEPELVE